MKKTKFIYTAFVALTILFTLNSCHLFHKNTSDYDVSEDYTDASPDTAYANTENDVPYQNPADKVWQLMHTDLNLTFNWADRTVQGTAILKLKPYFYAQDSLVLDAKAMDILSVEINQPKSEGPPPEKLNFSYTDSQHLVIHFKTIQMPFGPVEIKINYIANPERELVDVESNAGSAILAEKGIYFINHDLRNPAIPRQLWSQGETNGSRCWFPTIDQPNQKHTQRITLTYPDTMVSISNGERLSHTKLEKTKEYKDVWEQTQPHSVYLTMIAIGNWAETVDNYKGKQVRYFVEPNYKKDAMAIFGHTPKMIEFFSNYTGVDYPWKKFDQVVCREFVSGAMENTTAVVHSEGLQDKDNDMEDYISHELFHHWFGDYVTCDNWGEITMNESFARYSEMLWNEHYYGLEKAQSWLDENNTAWLYSEKITPLVNYRYRKADDQFDEIRYNKGAAILNLLRDYIGDEAFKLSMKEYLTTYAYGNATTAEWKRCIEKVSGKNMTDFFNSWYFSNEVADVQWGISKDKNVYQLEITQSTGKCFKIDIDYSSYDGLHRHKKSVWFASNESSKIINLEIDTMPDYVILNPNNTLVGTVIYNPESLKFECLENTTGLVKGIPNTNAIYKLLINNIFEAKFDETKVHQLASLNANIANCNEYVKSQSKKLEELAFKTNNSQMLNLSLSMFESLNPEHDFKFYNSELKQMLFSDKTKTSMKQTLIILLGGSLTENELIEISKNANYTLLEYCMFFGFNKLVEFKKIQPTTIDYAKQQMNSLTSPKLIAAWVNLVLDYQVQQEEDISKTLLDLKNTKIDIEQRLEVYKNCFNGLGNYNSVNNAFMQIADKSIESKDIETIKILKVSSLEYFKGLNIQEKPTTETARLLSEKVRKVHNFPIN